MKKPPRVAEWIMACIIEKDEREFIMGDLTEFYSEKARSSGLMRAYLWYWSQLLKSFFQFQVSTFFWRIAMIKNYLTIALRNIKKRKGYSFINIAGLAIGMACCIFILLWVQDELSFDSFHQKTDDLYRITISFENGAWESSPWALVPTLKRDYPEIIKGTRYLNRTLLIKHQENIYFDKCALVDPVEFLEMFTFPFIVGDPQTAFSHLNSVVLTEKTAKKYFGTGNPLGKIISLENRVDLKVTGIIKNVPPYSHMQFDLITCPVHLVGEERMKTWSMDCPSYVLLQPGADAKKVQQKIAGTIIKRDKRTNHKYYVNLQPLKRVHLYALEGTDPMIWIYIFSTIAVIVLLIACINFMNLSTASSSIRMKEIGTRKVFGAARRDLIKQFLGESMVMAIIALGIAILIVLLLLPVFNNLASKQLKFNLLTDLSIVIKLIVISLITGLIAGSYPAFYFSSSLPVNVLKSGKEKGTKKNGLRKILTITQFSAAIILIICTSVIYKQIQYIRTKDLGFNREQIITIRTDRELRKKYDTVKKELLTNLNIKNVTAASSIPLLIDNTNPVYWEGKSSQQYVPMKFVCLDYEYFETFNMKMAFGRSFSREYSTDIGNYIINEAALKLTGYKDPIGKMFSMWGAEGKIVGVVKDFHGTTLHNEIRPIVFVLYENLPYIYMFIKVIPTNITKTIDFIKDTMGKFSPDYPVNYQFLDEYFHQQYLNETHIANILKYFTILAIFISCLGLFGLATFMASRRAKEVAIRKVLGAPVRAIISILSKEFVLLVAIANLIAWPLAYFLMNKWIQNFAFHTTIGLWLFVLSGVMAFIIALVTVSYQTFRAATANPVDRLRNE